jgi:hypothetical protein
LYFPQLIVNLRNNSTAVATSSTKNKGRTIWRGNRYDTRTISTM